MYHITCHAPKKKHDIAYGMVLSMHQGIFLMQVHIFLGVVIGRPAENRG